MSPYAKALKECADLVWEKQFVVSVPYRATLSAQEIKHYGTFTYGSKARDDAYLNDRIVVMNTTNQMIELYKSNTPISIPNIKDVGEIYEIINNYLVAYANYIQNTIVQHAVPAEDLLLMDKFANEIKQQYNLFVPEQAPRVSELFKLLTTPLTAVKQDPVAQEKKDEATGHVSHSSIFSNALFDFSNKPGKPATSKLWK